MRTRDAKRIAVLALAGLAGLCLPRLVRGGGPECAFGLLCA
jgi:hypothetical protein